MKTLIKLGILGAAFFASLPGGVAASQAAGNAFHPKDATVWDELHHKFVWRDACGNNCNDHQVAGGFEWEGDSRDFIALGEGWVRKQRRGGLFMLSFPDGNKLSASWPVELPKGHVWRLRYALTDEAAAKTRDGLKFTVVATDAAGNPHTLVERVLKPRDQRIYEEEIRFEFDVRKITFVHDNLGSEVWDVLWILPDGLVIPRTGAPAVPNPGLTALRQAIEDLCSTFPRDYPRGPEFLARLDQIQKGMADANPGDAAGLAGEFEALRREALIASPLVSGRSEEHTSELQSLS